MALITHPHLALRLKKEYSYMSPPPLGLHCLTRVNFTSTLKEYPKNMATFSTCSGNPTTEHDDTTFNIKRSRYVTYSFDVSYIPNVQAVIVIYTSQLETALIER